MSAILGWLITNPTILAILAGVFASAIAYLKGRKTGTTAERNRNRAKEADAYEQHLKEIADAADARPSGSLQDDWRNRDNR